MFSVRLGVRGLISVIVYALHYRVIFFISRHTTACFFLGTTAVSRTAASELYILKTLRTSYFSLAPYKNFQVKLFNNNLIRRAARWLTCVPFAAKYPLAEDAPNCLRAPKHSLTDRPTRRHPTLSLGRLDSIFGLSVA